MGKNKEEKATKKIEKGNFKERLSLRFRRNFIASKISTFLLTMVLIVAFIVLNIWAQAKVTAQIDVTENKLYTLSDASKEQIKNINKEVMIYIYSYDDSSTYVNFANQYTKCNKNIKAQIVTTDTNYEIIKKYELDVYNYGAMVVVCGDKDITLYPENNFSSSEYVDGNYVQVNLMEEKITNAILNVSSDEVKKIYFLTGHGETQTSAVSKLVEDLENTVYKCESLNLMTEQEIPNDCDVLVILNPSSDVSAEESEALKAYTNRGGMIFLTQYKTDENAKFDNLQSFMNLYGAEVEYGLLYEGNRNNYYQNYRYVLQAEASTLSDITSDLASSGYYTIFPYTQRVKSKATEGENIAIGIDDLLYTSRECYNITSSEQIYQGVDLETLKPDRYTPALKFNRELMIKGEDGETNVETIKSSLVVVGNANFILDDYYTWTANKTFVQNCFAALSKQEDLMTIKKYSSSSSTFSTTATTVDGFIVQTIVFVIPVLIIITGIVVWVIRKRKR